MGETQTARKLAAVIQTLHTEGKEVNWTLHERGHAIFKQALKIATKKGVTGASKQTVFYANPTINLNWMDRFRKKAGMQLAKNPPLMNDLSISQSVLTGNIIGETFVSMRQIAEQGESANRNRTKGKIIMRAVSRVGIVSSVVALPAVGAVGELVGAALWGVSMLSIAASNVPGTSKAAIEGPGDIIDNIRSKFK